MTNMLSSLVMSARGSRSTNFSIEAIMSEAKKEAQDEAEEDEEVDVDVDVEEEDESQGLIVPDMIAEDKLKRKEKRPKVVEQSTCPDLDTVHCTLENKELWDKFCEFGTEMIITRTGRRMFPTVRCSFAGLDNEPGTKYLVLLDIVPCDNKRYRYAYHRSAWLVAGKADPPPPHRLHPHPDGPFTAEQLRKQVIGFEKVKITNNESDNSGQLILNSMHKFQPRVYLVKRREGHNSPISDIEKEQYRTFVFPETQFTAVTAYQNQCITKLKIESNPFAKGFRDSAGSDFDDHHHGSPFSSMGSPFGPSAGHHLPGGMPGLDPFTRLHYHHQAAEANNNLIMAAEKARFMMLYPGAAAAARSPPTGPPPPPHPSGLLPPAGSPPSSYSPLPLSPELLARYSALQASLGLYSPALLAAALRNSAIPPPPVSSSSSSSVPSSLNSSLSSPRSPELPSPRPHRFSPYVVPSRSGDSPAPHSPLGDDRAVSPPPHFPQLLR